MIEQLIVAVPKDLVPREPSAALDRFERVTGIKSCRRYRGSTTYGMICDALDQVKVVDVPDQVVVITQSPDQLSPCMAAEIHDYLELPSRVLAFDVNHACDGWAVGMHLANRLHGRTMLICADRLRYKKDDPIEGRIFSDAVSITFASRGVNEFKSYTDGSKAGYLSCGLKGEMTMNGDVVFDFVTTKVPDFIRSFAEYDFLAPHQANLSMNKILEMRSGYRGRTLYSIEEYGNQSMNSVPCNLAHNEVTILGKNVLCVGFGAGFTAAGIGLYWPREKITKIVEI